MGDFKSYWLCLIFTGQVYLNDGVVTVNVTFVRGGGIGMTFFVTKSKNIQNSRVDELMSTKSSVLRFCAR